MTNGEYQQLVEFLGRQFAAVDARFVAIDRRFDAIDRRLDAHDERFREILGHLQAIYGRLERLEQEYYAIIEGMRRIELILSDERGRREVLERGLAELKERVALLQARIDEMERRLRS
jgi:chromosome segregation ATPase